MEDDFMNLLFVSDDGLTMGFDTNGDGQADVIQTANYHDGSYHQMTAIDSDHNGIMDRFVAESDMDGDGYFETLTIADDYDQDGIPDHMKMFQDPNMDGDFEVTARFHADNENPDVAYRVEVDVDTNGDHVSDIHHEDVIPADDLYSADYAYSGAFLGSPDASGRFDPETPADQVVGDPAGDMEVWEHQGQTNRCALFSQKFVIEQLTGQDIDIEEFASIAVENGWFSEEGGTVGLNMNKMLEYYGVDNEVVYDSNMEQLEAELAAGNKVIVSVDSGQIWYGNDNDIFSPMTGSDHALQVIGIDYSDPENPMVILNDSGSPAGCGEMVPYDVFENAWGAGDHQMVVCHA